jgi:hypothetical protein
MAQAQSRSAALHRNDGERYTIATSVTNASGKTILNANTEV